MTQKLDQRTKNNLAFMDAWRPILKAVGWNLGGVDPGILAYKKPDLNRNYDTSVSWDSTDLELVIALLKSPEIRKMIDAGLPFPIYPSESVK